MRKESLFLIAILLISSCIFNACADSQGLQNNDQFRPPSPLPEFESSEVDPLTESMLDQSAEIIVNVNNLKSKTDSELKINFIAIFYNSVESYIKDGISKSEAIELTKKSLTEKASIYNKAQKTGFSISMKDSMKKVNDQLQDVSASHNILIVYIKSNVSWNDFLKILAEPTRMSDTINLYYESIKKGFLQKNNIKDENNNDRDYGNWNKYWKTHKENIIKEMQQTEDIKLIEELASDYDRIMKQYIDAS